MNPIFLVSPPPMHWDAGGGDDGNFRAAEAKKRGDINPRRALLAWIRFIDFLVFVCGAEVIVMPPPPRGSMIFDTCFTRDLFFFVPGHGIVMARMKAWDRLGEPSFAEAFLRHIGLKIYGTMDACMEGDSCFFLLPNETAILLGCGSRTDVEAGGELKKLFNKPVLPLLLNKYCFHMDLAGAPLRSRKPTVMFHRDSLAERYRRWRPEEGWLAIKEACRIDRSDLIEVSDEDARRAVLNSRDIGGQLLAPPGASEEFWDKLRAQGYVGYPVPLEELLENGGGFTGCLSNPLGEALAFSNCKIPEQYTWPIWRDIAMAMVSLYPTQVEKKPHQVQERHPVTGK